MTIQQLQYILEVQRTGSISQTAKLFLVSQANVSSLISTLEQELGFPIFTRSWRGVVPTERGLEVLENAKGVCEHYNRILKTKESADRIIRIYSHRYQPFFDAGSDLIMENTYQQDTSFLLENEGDRTKAMERLARFEGELFLAIVFPEEVDNYRQQAEAMGLELQARALIPVVASIGPGHRMYDKGDLSLKDLEQDVLISYSRKTSIHPTNLLDWIDFTPRRTLRVYSKLSIRELLERGAGFTIGPKHPGREQLRTVPIPDVVYQVISVTNPNRQSVPEVERYLELLDERLVPIAL